MVRAVLGSSLTLLFVYAKLGAGAGSGQGEGDGLGEGGGGSVLNLGGGRGSHSLATGGCWWGLSSGAGPLEVFLLVLWEGGGVEGEGMHFSSACGAEPRLVRPGQLRKTRERVAVARPGVQKG